IPVVAVPAKPARVPVLIPVVAARVAVNDVTARVAALAPSREPILPAALAADALVPVARFLIRALRHDGAVLRNRDRAGRSKAEQGQSESEHGYEFQHAYSSRLH